MEIRFPWAADLPTPHAPVPVETPAAKRRGRRPATAPSAAAGPGWLYHHLTVTGLAEPLGQFAEAARGAGVVPWQLDIDRFEEDVFNLVVVQPPARRNLTVAGCRILARQFRDCVAAHRARATTLVGRSRACPFDLHALLPVPDAILQLGPIHPESLAWLSTEWGLTEAPRRVVTRPQATAGRHLPAGHAVIGYGFFTADETPQPAIDHLGARWPQLRFVLQPRLAD